MSISMKLSPHQQNQNPMVPSLICGDRVGKGAELIRALRHGSGVARNAIYEMAAYCVTQGEPARADCRETIEEVTARVVAAVRGGALRRAEFLPDFIEIVTRVFLRQQASAEDENAADAVLANSRNQAPAPSRRESRLRPPRAEKRRVIPRGS